MKGAKLIGDREEEWSTPTVGARTSTRAPSPRHRSRAGAGLGCFGAHSCDGNSGFPRRFRSRRSCAARQRIARRFARVGCDPKSASCHSEVLLHCWNLLGLWFRTLRCPRELTSPSTRPRRTAPLLSRSPFPFLACICVAPLCFTLAGVDEDGQIYQEERAKCAGRRRG